uniref:Uncharacterized protein n=1 Tax=uncultured Chromatiales bacterium HF0200_41F04 TaxID=710740 RepID=E0XV34_9GAMM|nr:hypothetical protein [uncultured Chromatiales bacterium HF0200_41F04]
MCANRNHPFGQSQKLDSYVGISIAPQWCIYASIVSQNQIFKQVCLYVNLPKTFINCGFR